MAAPVCIPTNNALAFPFLHMLSNTCLLIYDGHSDCCEVVSHCGFNFISLMTSDAEHPFIGLWVLVCPPWRSICQVLCPFFRLLVFLVLSHRSSLSLLEIKPLSEVSLANMFSHMVSSLKNDHFIIDRSCP